MAQCQSMQTLFPKSVLIACLLFSFDATIHAQSNQILGEIELAGSSDAEKNAGVWVDGQYVGYLKELKGSKKILLLPGEHVIVARQAGYKDFAERVTVQPNQRQVLKVTLTRDPGIRLPAVTAEVKLSFAPDRAAVFVDGVFVGHVGEFGGVGGALLVSPGPHTITFFLSGYQLFETEVNLAPNQKFQIKTGLVKVSTPAPTPTGGSSLRQPQMKLPAFFICGRGL